VVQNLKIAESTVAFSFS